MSDRLRHLQRQHTLLREHLAWIEAEIAREAPADATPAPASPATIAAPLPLAPEAAAARPAASDADELLEKYGAQERQNPADIRKGCFMVFASALLLLALGIGCVWVFFYR